MEIVLQELPVGNWFCSGNCSHIHTALTDLVASKEKDVPDPLLNLIKKKHEEKSLEIGAGLDVKWRVMNWKLDSDSDDSVETRKLLSKAVAIFHVSVQVFRLYPVFDLYQLLSLVMKF